MCLRVRSLSLRRYPFHHSGFFAYYCEEYSGRVAVLKAEGLAGLIQLIVDIVPDGADVKTPPPPPDMTRNIVRALQLLFDDFDARAAIGEAGGLESLMVLLHSECVTSLSPLPRLGPPNFETPFISFPSLLFWTRLDTERRVDSITNLKRGTQVRGAPVACVGSARAGLQEYAESNDCPGVRWVGETP
jgi:hypothetical protein